MATSYCIKTKKLYIKTQNNTFWKLAVYLITHTFHSIIYAMKCTKEQVLNFLDITIYILNVIPLLLISGWKTVKVPTVQTFNFCFQIVFFVVH